MAQSKSLSDLAEKMRDIDIAYLSTKTEGGQIACRPMSNNSQVDYDGDSYYFTLRETRTVADIEKDPKVALGFTGDDHFYVSVEGRAELIDDKEEFEDHWSPDLDKWFAEGVDTEGLVMLRVGAERIHYWDGLEQGEVKM